MLFATSDGEHLTGLWIEGQKYYAATLTGKTMQKKEDLPLFGQVREWLRIYFSGKKPDFLPPLAPKGSAFRCSVWDILLAIPRGTVLTYGAIAKQLEQHSPGKHVAAQAVGQAVGHNPIAIIIPCHRVVGSGGNLTGYAGGIDKKVQLLELEGTSMEHLHIPE
jgi:methylated-DNA-[protein]-cysteine S-methyltransferase